MPHMITYVPDGAMLAGKDMMLATFTDGDAHVFIRRSAIGTPAPFEEGWAAYRASILSPAPRAPKSMPDAPTLSIVPWLPPSVVAQVA